MAKIESEYIEIETGIEYFINEFSEKEELAKTKNKY